MNDIIQLIVNNGIVVCVAYMIYFQLTTMKDMNKTLKLMNQDIEEIKNKVR